MIEIKMIQDDKNERVRRNSRFMDKEIKAALKKSLSEIGRDLKKKTKSLIDQKPKHGVIYNRTIEGKSIKWRASAPGEAPARVTGKLRASIKYVQTSYNRIEFGSYGVEYAPFLEYKDIITLEGQGSRKIKPRPYLSAAYKSESGRIKQRIESGLKKVKQKIER